MENSIVVYVDYGQISFNIKSIMDKKKITRTQLAKRSGLHHQIIDRYYFDNVVRFDRDVLAKLCYILECSLVDIMQYEKPKQTK